MTDPPRIPDYVPVEWVDQTGEYILVAAYHEIVRIARLNGIDRVRYIIVPEAVYDMVKNLLDDDDNWFGPDGYVLTVLVQDTTWLE